jgi:hypothetical protein
MPAHIFKIGPYDVPGILQNVEVPDRALTWQITQGAAGGIGAATIWRGVKIDEGGIIITTLITDDAGLVVQDADDAARRWGAFVDLVHPKATTKPPTWDLSHPLLSAQRPMIQRGAHSKNKMLPYAKNSIAWVGSLVIIEYRPLKLARPAEPDPAKLDSNTVTPQNKREVLALELIEKVKNG